DIDIGSLRSVLPARPGDLAHIGQQLIDGDYFKVTVAPLTSEILDALDSVGSVLRRFDNYVQPAFYFFRVAAMSLEQLRSAEDSREGIVEIVRHTRGQLAEG